MNKVANLRFEVPIQQDAPTKTYRAYFEEARRSWMGCIGPQGDELILTRALRTA